MGRGGGRCVRALQYNLTSIPFRCDGPIAACSEVTASPNTGAGMMICLGSTPFSFASKTSGEAANVTACCRLPGRTPSLVSTMEDDSDADGGDDDSPRDEGLLSGGDRATGLVDTSTSVVVSEEPRDQNQRNSQTFRSTADRQNTGRRLLSVTSGTQKK